MLTNVRAWGNSQGIYIPKKLLREASISVDDSVELSVENGAIVIRKDNSADLRRKAWDTLKSIRNAHMGGSSEDSRDYRKEYEEYLDEKYDF